jgi:hypothetical protein
VKLQRLHLKQNPLEGPSPTALQLLPEPATWHPTVTAGRYWSAPKRLPLRYFAVRSVMPNCVCLPMAVHPQNNRRKF